MLLELARAKRTGVVDAAGPGARVRLYLEDGEVVFADEGAVGETLGRILVREKVLTEEQYTSAIECTADLRAKGRTARIGEVLVELEMITTEQLHAALSAQVRQKVVRALGWPSASFTFFECYGSLDVRGRYPTPLEPLVLAALRLAEPQGVEALFDQARDRWVALRGDPIPGGGSTRLETIARLNALRLRPAEEVFVRELDGTRTVASLLDTTAAVDPAVLLAALLLTDCLDLHAAPQGAPSRAPAPSAPKAASSAPKAAPSAPPPSSPPRTTRSSARPPPPEQKAEAQKVTARLRSAHAARRALANASPSASMPASAPTPSTPAAPIAPMARLLAEKAFQTGKRLLRANQIVAAAEELSRAASLYGAAEYDLWATWTAMRAKPETEATAVPVLRDAAERALDLDPELGFAWFVLSWLTRRNGDGTLAEELLERARTLDPEAVKDALLIRLRSAEPAAPAVTRGEVRALAAPLGSSPNVADAAPRARAPSKPDDTPHVVVSPRAQSEAPPPNATAKPTAPSIEPPRDEGAKATSTSTVPRPPIPRPASGKMRAVIPPPAAIDVAPAHGGAQGIEPPKTPATEATKPDAPPEATEPPEAKPAAREEEAPKEIVRTTPVESERAERAERAESSPELDAETEPLPTRPMAPRETPPKTPPEPRAAPARPAPSSAPSFGAIFVVVAVLVLAGYALERHLAGRAAEIARANAPAETSAPPASVPVAAEAPPTASAEPVSVAPAETVSTTAVGLSTETAGAIAPTASSAAPTSAAPTSAAPPAATSAAPLAATPSAAPPSAAPAPATSAVETEPRALGPAQGRLDLPKLANGHRVWVDGKLVGEPPAPLVVSCGHRVVKVGSAGREQDIDVPCGASVAVPYP